MFIYFELMQCDRNGSNASTTMGKFNGIATCNARMLSDTETMSRTYMRGLSSVYFIILIDFKELRMFLTA